MTGTKHSISFVLTPLTHLIIPRPRWIILAVYWDLKGHVNAVSADSLNRY
jgi:hypothetical protein